MLQVSGAWVLYKSNSLGDGLLSATLKGFTVLDDREGTEQEFRLAIGKPKNIGYNSLYSVTDDGNQYTVTASVSKDNSVLPVPTMLILDAKFSKLSTSVSLCVQRPQLLVALDFLLAIIEFFVPTVGAMLSNEEDDHSLHMVDAIILDQPIYHQPLAEMSLSPQRPFIVDNEKFDHFIYDGKGGILHLQDRKGFNLSASSAEPIIYVGNGKRLQFKNIVIKVLFSSPSWFIHPGIQKNHPVSVNFNFLYNRFWCRMDCIWILVFYWELIVATQLQSMIRSTWREGMKVLNQTLMGKVLIGDQLKVSVLIGPLGLSLSYR